MLDFLNRKVPALFRENLTKAGEWDSSEQAILIVAIRDYEAASPVSTPKS
ncbi:hypothetical protein N9Y55_02535 [bacterium]|nr:hypothetical protein [bacterium]